MAADIPLESVCTESTAWNSPRSVLLIRHAPSGSNLANRIRPYVDEETTQILSDLPLLHSYAPSLIQANQPRLNSVINELGNDVRWIVSPNLRTMQTYGKLYSAVMDHSNLVPDGVGVPWVDGAVSETTLDDSELHGYRIPVNIMNEWSDEEIPFQFDNIKCRGGIHRALQRHCRSHCGNFVIVTHNNVVQHFLARLGLAEKRVTIINYLDAVLVSGYRANFYPSPARCHGGPPNPDPPRLQISRCIQIPWKKVYEVDFAITILHCVYMMSRIHCNLSQEQLCLQDLVDIVSNLVEVATSATGSDDVCLLTSKDLDALFQTVG